MVAAGGKGGGALTSTSLVVVSGSHIGTSFDAMRNPAAQIKYLALKPSRPY